MIVTQIQMNLCYVRKLEICKYHAETGTNYNETKQQGTNWNDETLLDEIKPTITINRV